MSKGHTGFPTFPHLQQTWPHERFMSQPDSELPQGEWGTESPRQRWQHLCAQPVMLPNSLGQRVSQSNAAFPRDRAQLSGTFRSVGQPGTFQPACLPAKARTQGWLQSLPLAGGP